jgi:hypothetical protein
LNGTFSHEKALFPSVAAQERVPLLAEFANHKDHVLHITILIGAALSEEEAVFVCILVELGYYFLALFFGSDLQRIA